MSIEESGQLSMPLFYLFAENVTEDSTVYFRQQMDQQPARINYKSVGTLYEFELLLMSKPFLMSSDRVPQFEFVPHRWL